eukprot:15843628-Heterocapsa_arctica.AAC.1
MEQYCVTCSAWRGDDPTNSGHIASDKHKNWQAHYESQRMLRAMDATKHAQAGSVGPAACPAACV